MDVIYFIYGSLIVSVVFMFIFNYIALRQKVESKRTQEIGDIIQKSAMAFMRTEYLYIAVFVIFVALILLYLFGQISAISFIIGSVSSGLAGFFGMNRATIANVVTANSAKYGLNPALKTSFYTGSAVGLFLVVIGVAGLLLIIKLFPGEHRDQAIIGYSFGVAAIALFSRVAGGIFTKAADVGADLVGKVEAGIPEDDPRNPAVIADNVGDNVGDTAGMGADLFDSLIVNLISAMLIGLVATALPTTITVLGDKAETLFYYPLFVVCAGLLAAIVGTFFCFTSGNKPGNALQQAFLVTCIVLIGIVFFTNKYFFGTLDVFYCVVAGVVAGLLVGKVTEYYTSFEYSPVKNIAESANVSSATNIISGLSTGMMSTFGVVAILMISIGLSYHFAGLYGVTIAGVGMLSLAAITMAVDVFGPIVDNAGGIAEMSELPKNIREKTDALDAAGNTTAAIGKGFAIGSAALAAMALLSLYAQEAGLSAIDLLNSKVMIGLFLGGVLPYIFSAFVFSAVGKAAMDIVHEVRRQFRTIKGIMTGKGKPDYDACIVIATKGAIVHAIIPGLLVIGAPLLVGFFIGKDALGGMLAGTLVSGILLGVMQSNAGGAWDNAKKYIEKGNFGGKGSPAHKAAVVGDTVGDPCKDSSGPAINIVIKLTILVSTVFVTLF